MQQRAQKLPVIFVPQHSFCTSFSEQLFYPLRLYHYDSAWGIKGCSKVDLTSSERIPCDTMIWWLSCLLLKCVQTCCLNNPSPHKQSFIHKKGAFLVKWHNSGLCVAKGNWATVNSWSRRRFWRWYEQVCLWDSVGITFTTDSQRRKDHCWVWRCQCHVTYVVWRSTCDNTFVRKVFLVRWLTFCNVLKV